MQNRNSQMPAVQAGLGEAWQNPPDETVKCKRETLRKRLRCHNVIKLFTECGRRDPKVGDYIVYLVATTNLCDKREQPYVLSGLFVMGANPNATYRRRPVLSIVLDSIGSDYIRDLQAVVIARTFISYGADPNVRDRRGNTLLHYAVQYGWIDDGLVEVPLSLGADPNIRNKNGETPLHIAVKCRYLHAKAKIVKLLLEYGADPRIRDRSGRTPLDYAEDEEIAEMLRATLKSVA
jgi:ankyrin repeat protein